jgi:precorrin-6B C5,15-methyltransferase / cobalt-precorrin-6B C5,C15-methyltransferase
MGETGVAATHKWLSIVGIGEDGLDGLGRNAVAAISAAEIVFGGARHLALAAQAIRGEARPWASPFDPAMHEVLALRGRPVCVLASGDPFWHGVGGTLARLLPPAELASYPAPSAFSLAASRLGWPLQDVETISLHGRPIAHLRPLLHPGTRILALTSDGEAPALIGSMLAEAGFGSSPCHVLEALGGSRETVTRFEAASIGTRRFDPLNIVAIEVVAGSEAAVLPLGGAIPDDMFDHDGQITKSDVRAIVLAALAPRRGALLWDIGAGSGSVAISWMLAHPSMRAIAIEARADRAGRIRRNAASLGVPSLEIVEGRAPAALDGVPAPDAIFIGGGGSEAGVSEMAMKALKPGGRLVANAVTLEMEAVLLALQRAHGGDLLRIALQRAEPVGGMTGWRPAMPVTRWTWVKPS